MLNFKAAFQPPFPSQKRHIDGRQCVRANAYFDRKLSK